MWENPEGPPVKATVNSIPELSGRPSRFMFNVILPSFELLHVSLVDWILNVSDGRGLGSQTSPTPSPSVSDWSEFEIFGQLSISFKIPSLSSSFEITFKEILSSLNLLVDWAFRIKS